MENCLLFLVFFIRYEYNHKKTILHNYEIGPN